MFIVERGRRLVGVIEDVIIVRLRRCQEVLLRQLICVFLMTVVGQGVEMAEVNVTTERCQSNTQHLLNSYTKDCWSNVERGGCYSLGENMVMTDECHAGQTCLWNN